MELIKLSELFKNLVTHLGYVIFIALIISRVKSFKQMIQKKTLSKGEIIFQSLLFGGLGILGTYVGIDVRGAIANTRNIGVIAGGLLGGPYVGIFAGIIAGLHRFLIDVHGITSLPCAIATVIGGFISGVIYNKSTKKNRWIYGLLGGIVVENISMGLILLISKPYDLAFLIVKEIYIPMIFVNGLGIAIVIIICENLFEVEEEIAARTAKLALEITNKTLPYFRDINEKSLEKVCEIIKESVEADAVSITDRENILAHVGKGEDHHIKEREILTKATEEVIKTGKVQVLQNANNIICPNKDCPLKSAIIVPLKENSNVVGTLKIYYIRENAVTHRDQILAEGLSQLISTQLEISKIENLKDMANRAEIKALQAQINPHFIFNALNTITSFVRINPSKARELIINLSTYLRYNLERGLELVSLAEELEQVKAYVEIEQARYGNRLNIIYNIEEDIDIKIPSLIIQPLVENAIKHGILKVNAGGTVKVSVSKEREDHQVIISIEDNGVGIAQEVIDAIYQNKMKESKIGLSNVHNRLKLFYGKGLNITRLENGTKISFTVPENI